MTHRSQTVNAFTMMQQHVTASIKEQMAVIEFLSRELAIDKSKIWPSSRIRQDLAIDGADAIQLIEAFAVAFEVDIEAFRFTDYFGERVLPQWAAFILGIFGNARPLKTLTVQNLIYAALTKTLL